VVLKNLTAVFANTPKKSERLPRAKYDSRIVPIIDWNSSK
jgi:hypothetical protein